MPHTIHVDGTVQPLHDEWSLPGLALHVFRTAADDALVITAATGAMRDGVPVFADLAIVRWDDSALLRVDGRKIEIAWHDASERRCARAGERCRVCFEALAGDEVIACPCHAVCHVWPCDAVRINCQSCGRSREEVIHE